MPDHVLQGRVTPIDRARGPVLDLPFEVPPGVTRIDVRYAFDDGHTLDLGLADPASAMPVDASRLYAKNVTNLLALGLTEEGWSLDLEDEVLDGVCLVHEGTVRHAPTAALLEEG